MSEAQDQGQSTQPEESTQEQTQQQANTQEDRVVPYHRFTQLNETNKQLQKELAEIRKAKDTEAEERAKRQGEFERLYKNEKARADREKQARVAMETDVQRDRRLRVFSSAAAGVIRPEAVEDSFYMLSAEEFGNIDDADEAAMRRVAESLVERKPYLGDERSFAGGGSGGYTNRPILGADLSPDGKGNRRPQGKKPLFGEKKRRPSWK